MKLILVRPNWTTRRMILPPLGLGYISAAAKKARHKCWVYDAWLKDEGPEQAAKGCLLLPEADIIGVQVYQNTVEWTRVFVGLIRKYTERHLYKVLPRLIVGGPYVTALGEAARIEMNADTAVIGEFETDIDEHLNEITSGKTLIEWTKWIDVNEHPFPDWDSMNLPDYWPYIYSAGAPVRGKRVGFIQRTRGCPHKCLDGDTIINTINGDFQIKNLVGRKTKVLTRSKNGDMIYADAINIKKTGENERLLRIYFDNGEIIDCTPDHILKKFKNGNQYVKKREYDVRAEDLSAGDSIVSVHQYISRGYIEIHYGRHKHVLRHRLVMESTIGRKLKKNEDIHHIDRNRANNHQNNLLLVSSVSEHYALHPEIAQRMRDNNPAFKMNDEWRKKIGIACTGKKRTPEQRLHYRESKLGTKNPNHKNYKPYINHKVVRIEYLEERKDTYCMEVPGYDWFFANNILVHNCTFCASGGVIMGKRVRFRDLNNVLEEIEYLKNRWNIDELWFQDDDVTINHQKGVELFKALVPYKLYIRLQMGIRVDNLTDEMLYWMKRAGVYYAGIGIESGNPRVLKRIKKGLNQERVLKGISDLVKHNIQVMGFFMFGLPTETCEEMEETVQWAVNTKLHHAQFAVFIPYPGSYDYHERSLPSHDKLLKIQRNATLRFYLRPRILWSMLTHFKWKQLKAIIHHDWVWKWMRRK